MVDFTTVPQRLALINIDLQRCFVERATEGLSTVGRINRLATACRRAGILIVHTRHVLRSDGANMGILGEMIPKIKDGLLNNGNEAAAFHPALHIEPSDVLLEKPRFGAFHGTDLEVILRSRGIDTIIISGISTPICCDTTAREAHARDFRVFFLSDGTATTGDDGDACQKATLGVLADMFAQVLTVEEMSYKIAHAAEPVGAASRES